MSAAPASVPNTDRSGALAGAAARTLLGVAGGRRLSILIYHRVHREADPLFPGEPDARRFDRQMAWVGSALNVLPLRDAVDLLAQGRLPPRAASITFDDGYADNAEVAAPILRRHGFAATFFIATGFLDGGRMWNDTIIEAVRRASGTALALPALGLPPLPIESPSARRAAIDRIIDHLKYRPAAERQVRVDELAQATGHDLPDDLMMRSDQVRSLAAAGMDIGGHTVTHPILARIGPALAETEIRAGRAMLEAVVGRPITLFAYPNGRPGADYGPEHVAMVRDLGFAAALSTHRGTAGAATDPFQLPRFTPWGGTFARFVAGLARNQLGLI